MLSHVILGVFSIIRLENPRVRRVGLSRIVEMIMKSILYACLAAFLPLLVSAQANFLQYINPLVGSTGGGKYCKANALCPIHCLTLSGNVFAGATLPFGKEHALQLLHLN